MILRQTFAIFVDQYRELNAKKLFWITLALSLLLVGVFAGIGIGPNGMTAFGLTMTFTAELGITTEFLEPALFYKILFTSLGLFYLSWIATTLALVSTAGIMPDLVASGSIETVLSKPIGRLRLFLTKYLTGLMFVGLQVAAFSVGCLVVFGLKGQTWEFGLLLAVPIVLLFYSYLFSVCALVGVITRSTVFALLTTLLFWGAVFVVNLSDGILLGIESTGELQKERAERVLERRETRAASALRFTVADGQERPDGFSQAELDEQDPEIPRTRRSLEDSEALLEALRPWRFAVSTLSVILPQTDETIGLLERNLVDLGDLAPESDEIDAFNGFDGISRRGRESAPPQELVQQRVAEKLRARPMWRIIGTSLVFELVMVGAACVIFVRRDF